MGNMNRFRNQVIRTIDPKTGKPFKGKDKGNSGLSALRAHRATNKAMGVSRKSGWSKKLPQWLKDYLYGK